MSNLVDSGVSRVLDGLGLEQAEHQLCDFTIGDQNLMAESQGITPSTSSDYKPLLGSNVTYVVAAVIFNESNDVLMIQEAKESCAGTWYLPAGRMEKGENIIEAVKREVREETGFNCRPISLLAVETAGGMWTRFVMTAVVTDGEIKTPARADQESLQAKWISDLGEVSLRSNDILPLIERAKMYKERSGEMSWHKEILPNSVAHSRSILRLIIVIKKRSTNRVHVLLSEKTAIHFPTTEIHPGKSVHSTLRRFMVEIFGADVPQHKPHGILSVEYDGASDSYGYCLTLLVVFRSPLEEVPLIAKCAWYETSKEIGDRLLQTDFGPNFRMPILSNSTRIRQDSSVQTFQSLVQHTFTSQSSTVTH